MKTSFTYNLLKHLREKKQEGGFTLIELLVVIIIIGILAAIALPAFLNQANRARETEAANSIGAASRGQQAYFLEELQFAPALSNLEVGVDDQGNNYRLADEEAKDGGTAGNFKTDGSGYATLYGQAKAANLKDFAGTVYNESGGGQTVLLCRDKVAGTAGVDFTLENTNTCPTANSESL